MTDNLRGDSPLDQQLDTSAPSTSADTVERVAALQALARETGPQPRSRRRRSVVISSIAGLLALGIGGAAAASAFNWHSPWADDAVAEITYALPSGAVCTGIIGNFKGDPDTVAAAEEFMSQPNLLEAIDADAEFEKKKASADNYGYYEGVDNGETLLYMGPGSPYWSDDQAYERAVLHAASNAITAQLDAKGVTEDGLEWESEQTCPGAVEPSYGDEEASASNE